MSLRLMSAIIPVTSPTTKTEDADKVLSQLLECVQHCQKRYGGKTELATEFDTCVAALCLSLEAVFLHGIRTKPQEPQQTSTFKQVSDIVTSSLNLSTDNRSFWPFVKKHLTKHERERYEVLKHIWTDTGRGRAWIRSSLNERSLERNFHTVLSNSKFLQIYYDDGALLCDDEKNSMLPNMAAGLGSILFAISIDKPELNSETTSQKSERLRTPPEPIIEAPIREPSRDRSKRKRKVAKQIISFDEDDTVLSSSIPSSSSSITSDNNSCTSDTSKPATKETENKTMDKKENIPDKPKRKNNETTTETKKEKPKRKLSLEKSGSHDKFATKIDGTLTPVEQTSVGELTPVSVEKNKNSESPDTSDDIIEMPTDISAVLTAVETKNKEELNKMQDNINRITKENDCLKEQLKKYISAIQMLRSEDGNIHTALEGLQLDVSEVPDYKSEAKVFEKKLVQVAEMHAELMDFNVHLQQCLCQKDSLLDRLKGELEELRGPLPFEVLSDESHRSVNIWIPSAFLTGTGSDVHHVYQIFLRAGADEWNIYRRYAQFHALHIDLKKLDPSVATFDFPPKKSLGRKDSSLVEDRRKRLQTYLRRILSHWPELAHCSSRFLLEQHLAFFKDQKTNDNRTKKSLFSSRRSGASSSDNHYTGL